MSFNSWRTFSNSSSIWLKCNAAREFFPFIGKCKKKPINIPFPQSIRSLINGTVCHREPVWNRSKHFADPRNVPVPSRLSLESILNTAIFLWSHESLLKHTRSASTDTILLSSPFSVLLLCLAPSPFRYLFFWKKWTLFYFSKLMWRTQEDPPTY